MDVPNIPNLSDRMLKFISRKLKREMRSENALFVTKQQNLDDKLGQAYEYFLGMFALSEGKGAGAFYTTESIVKTIV